MQAQVWMLSGCLALAAAAGCTQGKEGSSADRGVSPPAAKADAFDVLVTVNGVPIRDADLQFALASKARGGKRDALLARKTLEKLIDQELARQAAESQGLHDDPEYLRKLHFMEAPVNDFQRETLSQAFFKRVVDQAPQVTDDEARKHFDDNPEHFKVRYQIWQILVKGDDAKLAELEQQLDDGAPFEEVAATRFPPEIAETGQRPWELNGLRWDQLPKAWQKALPSMKDGDVSDILRGPNKRAWIIKLVARVTDESATFEALKPQVIAALENARGLERGRAVAKELRNKATIVRVRSPSAVAAPPEDDR